MKFTLRNKSSELILCFIAFVGIFFSIGFINPSDKVLAQNIGDGCNTEVHTWRAYAACGSNGLRGYLLCVPVGYDVQYRVGTWQWGGEEWCGAGSGPPVNPGQPGCYVTSPNAPHPPIPGGPAGGAMSPGNLVPGRPNYDQVISSPYVTFSWYLTGGGGHVWGEGCPTVQRQWFELERVDNSGSVLQVYPRALLSSNQVSYGQSLPVGRYRWRIVLDNGAYDTKPDNINLYFRVCYPLNPERPVLTSPADGSVHTGNAVLVHWNQPSNWGNVCSGVQSNQVRVQWRVPYANGVCPAEASADWNTATSTVWFDGTVYQSRYMVDLLPNRTYCWRVQARNSASGAIVNSNPLHRTISTCVSTNPTSPANISPADSHVLSGVSTTLSWNPPSSWGIACGGNNNRYRVQIDQGCTGNYVNQAYQSSSSLNSVVNNLLPNTQYCWRVEASNGGGVAYSEATSFRTASLPVISSGDIAADVCGNRYTGRLDTLGTSNPIRMSIGGDVEAGGTPRMVVVALLPVVGAYAETAQFVDWETAHSKAVGAGSYVGGYNMMNGRYYTTRVGDNNWTSYTASDVDNGAGTVRALGIGTTTLFSASGTVVSGEFLLEIRDIFPNGLYNIYVMVDKELEDGSIVSSDMSGGARRLRRMGVWGIDTNAPSIVMADPTFNSSPQNSFSLRYSISDIAGGSGVSNRFLDMRSSDQAVVLSSSLGWEAITFSQPSVFEFKAGLEDTDDERTLSFTNLTPELQADLDVRLRATDLACNESERSSGVNIPSSWALFKGAAYYGAGNGMSAPSVSVDLFSLIRYSGIASISEGVGMVNTTQYPRRRGSLRELSILAYPNKALSLPLIADEDGWFNYLLGLAGRNTSSMPVISGNSLLESVSSYLEVPVDASAVTLVRPSGGSLDIASNAVCDARAVLFVEGDLSISPDFINNSPVSGCVFIVSGAVNILPGNRSGDIAVGSEVMAEYDVLEAFIFAGGSITIQADPNPSLGFKPDPIIVRGSLVSENIIVSRGMEGVDNTLQPSLIVEYDPRYYEIASGYLKLRSYKIREVLP